MKRLVLIAALIALAYTAFGEGSGPLPPSGADGSHAALSVASAGRQPADSLSFGRADSQRQVQGSGVVVRILRDDDRGSRHQKFILKLSSGQTVLVAHNIDLAPRVSPISLGEVIAFNGVFVWNEKGGVVHWTHHDPSGRHQSGWLRAGGQTFQ